MTPLLSCSILVVQWCDHWQGSGAKSSEVRQPSSVQLCSTVEHRSQALPA